VCVRLKIQKEKNALHAAFADPPLPLCPARPACGPAYLLMGVAPPRSLVCRARSRLAAGGRACAYRTAGRGSRPACPRCRDGQIEYLDRRARLCPLKKNLCPRFDYALRVQIVKSYSTARATPRCYAHTLRVEGVSAVAPPWGAGPESAPEHAPLRRGWRPLEEPEIGRYPARTQP
jgi:hypothetical protein